MAYTPINWQTGDTITADKLNKMDNGWGVESTQLFSETVTTVADGDENYASLAYVRNIDADTITVTFDGTKYACPRNDADDGYYYGDFDFITHPFFIIATQGEGSKPAINDVYTEAAGTHTIAAAVPTLQTSSDFDAARGWSYDAGGTRELFSETVTTAVDPEYSELAPSALLSYRKEIDADPITVTFDGTEYECQMNAYEMYGAIQTDVSYDFSEFPFSLDGGVIYTQTAGEHTVAVEANIAPSAKTSEQFALAVSATGLLPFRCVPNVTTYAEMKAAKDAGRLLYFYPYDNGSLHLVLGFGKESSPTAVTTFPEGTENVETYGFNSNMVFAVFQY